MTNIFAWNMRRLNKPHKQRVGKDWVRTVKPVFGCLVKTKIQQDNCTKNFEETFPGWQLITNYDHHWLGRIWVVWNELSEVTLIRKSAQMITCWVQLASGKKFLSSCIYASNFQADRPVLWAELEAIKNLFIGSNTPWIVLGDFNKILRSSDHFRYLDYTPNRAGMLDFQNIVSTYALEDINRSIQHTHGGIIKMIIPLARN